MELERMEGHYRSSHRTIFSGKIFCGECGSIFGSKVWHSTDQYRRTIWQCNAKFDKKGRGECDGKAEGNQTSANNPTAHKPKCTTPHLTEEKMKSSFITAFNFLLENKAELLQTYRAILKDLTNTKDLNETKQSAQREYDEILVLMEKAIAESGSGGQITAPEHITPADHPTTDYLAPNFPQCDFDSYYADILKRADSAKARLQSANDEILRKTKQRRKLNAFMSELENRGDLLTEFEEELFAVMVEKITVYKGKLIFLFKDGSDIDIML